MSVPQVSDPVTCPSGHEVDRDQMGVRDGMWTCPVCDDAREWAPTSRARWSRRSLRGPLWGLSVLNFVAGISSSVVIWTDTAYVQHHLAGSTSLLVSQIIYVPTTFAFSVVYGWLAVLVGRRD